MVSEDDEGVARLVPTGFFRERFTVFIPSIAVLSVMGMANVFCVSPAANAREPFVAAYSPPARAVPFSVSYSMVLCPPVPPFRTMVIVAVPLFSPMEYCSAPKDMLVPPLGSDVLDAVVGEEEADCVALPLADSSSRMVTIIAEGDPM